MKPIETPIGLAVEGLSKVYPTAEGARTLFQDLCFTLPLGARLGILGRNGQGKSTLIRILGGVLPASSGRVAWGMSASWPIGFSGAFQGSLSGLDNIRFISRIYGRPFEETLQEVEGFAELGQALKEPVKQYSSGMRTRLAFGLSLAIEFDCYLIDEVIAVGDAAFQAKCRAELFEKRAGRSFMMASHDTRLIQETCSRALLIEGGRAKVFDDVAEAIDIYTSLGAA